MTAASSMWDGKGFLLHTPQLPDLILFLFFFIYIRTVFGTPCSSLECLKNSTKTFFLVASVLERVSNSFVYLTLLSQYQ